MKKNRLYKTNGKWMWDVLPSEIKLMEDDIEVQKDFATYAYARLNKDKEVYYYYEKKYHGTKYQKIFNKKVEVEENG